MLLRFLVISKDSLNKLDKKNLNLIIRETTKIMKNDLS